jgi:WD40 repeat protein
MKSKSPLAPLFIVVLTGSAALADTRVLPPGEKEPLLRLEAGGPTAFVTALAFNRDGTRLYAAGWDKVVRVWNLNGQGKFVLGNSSYRVPLGMGVSSAINAIALSDDETWLAVGGLGIFRGETAARRPGYVIPAGDLDLEMLRDRGMIYVFNTRTHAVRILRKHEGSVVAVAFAPTQQNGKSPMLVSARKLKASKRQEYAGEVIAWDIDAEVPIGVTRELPIASNLNFPGLAIWHFGNTPRHTRVAIAWDDGILRVWEVERDRVREMEEVQKSPARLPPGTITVAKLPGREQLISAVPGAGQSQLHSWKVNAGNVSANQDPAEKNRTHLYPRALALVSSRANGTVDHAAVVVRALGTKDVDFRLQLQSLSEADFGAVKSEAVLWTASGKQPVVAASPFGPFIAVAGNDSHEILVYSIKDLLENRFERQTLSSVGTTLRYAAFVSKGKDQGLLLSDKRSEEDSAAGPRDPAAGDLIFDFSRRRLTDDTQGWTAWTPRADSWTWRKLASSRDHPAVIQVSDGEQEVGRVRLSSDWTDVTAALFPRRALGVPILAVAYHIHGEPALKIYNAESGEQVRQLTGHAGRVYSLFFSGDGRLLVSVAEDQTVSVWSLTNLAKLIGQKGRIDGVAVKEKNGSVFVSSVAANSAASGKLDKDDVIESLQSGGRSQKTTRLLDFYDFVAQVKPGETVILAVRGRSGRHSVTLPVAQLVDERMPLFSLFITRRDNAEERDWIGWSPMGPYDTSRPQAERLLGWHFNTGDRKAPTKFARADQYRDYYSRDILRYLVTRANFTDGLKDWKRDRPVPPLPRISLRIDEAGRRAETTGDGRFLVHRRKVLLTAHVDHCQDLQIKSLKWRIDDGPVQDFRERAGLDRTADLSGVEWTRGVHKLTAILEAPHLPPGKEIVSESKIAMYQPPRPIVNWAPEILQKMTRTDPPRIRFERSKFRIEASANPSEKGEKIRIWLIRNGRRTELAGRPAAGNGLIVSDEIDLRPGTNEIMLRAENADALAGFQENEASTRSLTIDFVKPSRKPSAELSLKWLSADGSIEKRLNPNRREEADYYRGWLRGEIKGAENLSEAMINGKPLDRFAPGKSGSFAIDLEEKLKGGENKFRISARTENSERVEQDFVIFYRPKLPSIQLVTPAQGQDLVEGRDPRDFQFRWALIGAVETQLDEAEVRLRGVRSPAVIDKQARTLTARLTLQPSDNSIEIELRNPFRRTTVEQQVRFLQPPRDVRIDEPKVGRKPLLDLTGWAESRSQLTKAVITVIPKSGSPIRRELPASALTARKGSTWRVEAQDIPLEQGDNKISLAVINRDGQCLEPASVTVSFDPPPPPKALVTIKDPVDGAKIAKQARYVVRWRVQSESPLKVVELRQGQRILFREEALKDAEKEFVQEVSLEPGTNELEVAAINDGGESATPLTLSYVVPPVQIVIESLAWGEAPATNVSSTVEDGVAVFSQEVPQAKVKLRGRVHWHDAQARPATAQQVRISVNGFQQLASPLESKSDVESTFEAAILLNRPESNQVRVEVPDCKKDVIAQNQCLVKKCAKPITSQRLHLLAVGIGTTNEEELRKRALLAIRAVPDRANPGQYLLPEAFAAWEPPIVLAGAEAGRNEILGKIGDLEEKLKDIDPQKPVNDVVIFYYQGKETITKDGHYFETSESKYATVGDGSGVACDEIARAFGKMVGAHIVLLDVARNQGEPPDTSLDKVISWRVEPDVGNVGVFRSAWLGAGNEPGEVQLITTLKEALSKVGVLKKVNEEVSKSYATVKQVRYDPHLPVELGDLNIGVTR